MTCRSKLKRNKRIHDLAITLSFLVLIAFVGLLVKDHLFAYYQLAFDAKPQQEIAYKVESGDTLWLVAGALLEPGEDIRDKVITIRNLNGLKPTQSLEPGQIIRVPIKGTTDSGYRYASRKAP
jgi:hypothetical protein